MRPRGDNYASRFPGPEDAYPVIEVADTTLNYDRETKLPLYATAGVPEAWLVDLTGRQMEICTNTSDQGFRDIHRAMPPERISPQALPGLSISLESLF